MTTVDLEDFWPLDPALSENYWPTLEYMRTTCPVHHSNSHGGFWVLTRYDDVWRVARDYESFINSKGVSAVPFEDSRVRPVPAMADPPFQRSLRVSLDRYFSPRAVEVFEPYMRRVANELLDTFASNQSCEFMNDFATHYPARVFFERVLGLQGADVAQARVWADAMMMAPHKSASAWDEFGRWAQDLVDRRRAEGPRDPAEENFVDGLLAARFEGEPLSDLTLQGAIVNVTLGGLETTAMALGVIMHHVATEPATAAYLASPDCGRDQLMVAIEEFLRYETALPTIARVAARDVEIDGHLIKEGDRVVLFYGSGNRDEAMFPRAGELVLDRPIEENRHMTFGSGKHRCLGSNLARAELRVALEEIFARFSDITLDQPHVAYRNAISRGPVTLRLRFKEQA
ncbi:MAG TPA: cytochrome P450 [Jatrophihabitantaceae bacterium]|jgi:cytochrome P450|nr:cytochrome P450 [Jatrophihabitantaceae bacterium]